jgi:hypothetical protein
MTQQIRFNSVSLPLALTLGLGLLLRPARA